MSDTQELLVTPGNIHRQNNIAQTSTEDSLSGLDFLWLEITNRCNLRCSHCYAGSGPHEPISYGLTLRDWSVILNDARTLGCKKLQLIGGEPTLHPHIDSLLEEAHELGFEFIEIYTNGTHITEKLFSLIKNLRINLATSFYSEQPEIHDRITGVRGSHNKTVNTIKKSLSAGVPIRVGIIEMADNEGSVAGVISYLKNMGLNDCDIGWDRVRGFGRGTNHVDASDQYDQLCGSCWRGTLSVNSAGEVSPCIMSHFCNVGDIREGLATIVHSHQLKAVRQTIRLADEKKIIKADCQPDECRPGPPPPSCYPCDPQCNPITCRVRRSCHPDCTIISRDSSLLA